MNNPYLTANNNGDILYKYAVVGDFSILETVCREFVKNIYENEKESAPDILRLYDTGVNFVLLHLIRAWNIWHERTGNVDCSLSVMMFDRQNNRWVENIWYSSRL
jgi:hypothetical protein